jgi:hypothetical protein
MNKSRFSEHQIAQFLIEAEALLRIPSRFARGTNGLRPKVRCTGGVRHSG